jgi:hypothetical protein
VECDQLSHVGSRVLLRQLWVSLDRADAAQAPAVQKGTPPDTTNYQFRAAPQTLALATRPSRASVALGNSTGHRRRAPAPFEKRRLDVGARRAHLVSRRPIRLVLSPRNELLFLGDAGLLG